MENYEDILSSSGLKSLPIEMERNFMLMRKLDCRAQETMKVINKHTKKFLLKLASDGKPGAMSDEERKQRLAKIQSLFDKANEYSDDKVQLALQTYDLVDKQIRRLDRDLARIEEKIKADTSFKRNMSEEAVVKKSRRKTKDNETTAENQGGASSSVNVLELGASAAGGGNPAIEFPKNKGKKKTTLTPNIHSSDELNMPVDPHEPTFCICHQVAYGQMIGCDSQLCPIEWFHFACVGLTAKPKGKWYCPKCKQGRKNK